MDEKHYRLLTRTAIVLTVAWVGWTLVDSGILEREPGAYELDAARKNLEDGRYNEALVLYRAAFDENAENLGALRGMAQALMAMGTEAQQSALTAPKSAAEMSARALDYHTQALNLYNEAIKREEEREITPIRQRILGVAYANRGILRDRMGDHYGALSDYGKASLLEPKVAEGPGFLIRFMRNQTERPPTIADRARYLKAELSKPEDERLLKMPALDARQRAYSMD
ncbi:MAG: tetratricopeptide repeat protein [Gammaproteobacteria bacterium]|nr:tetratricopeptide repeat protein [Gammaproteobacteria bacterium]